MPPINVIAFIPKANFPAIITCHKNIIIPLPSVPPPSQTNLETSNHRNLCFPPAYRAMILETKPKSSATVHWNWKHNLANDANVHSYGCSFQNIISNDGKCSQYGEKLEWGEDSRCKPHEKTDKTHPQMLCRSINERYSTGIYRSSLCYWNRSIFFVESRKQT